MGVFPEVIGDAHKIISSELSVLCYVEFMPRKSRIDTPGALHHIIARGIDRNNFLERLSDIIAGTETKCFAWSLMPNHFYL